MPDPHSVPQCVTGRGEFGSPGGAARRSTRLGSKQRAEAYGKSCKQALLANARTWQRRGTRALTRNFNLTLLMEEFMADNLKERAPQDASRISLTEDWEVRYWTKALGVSKERLAQLVQQHGHSAKAVRATLNK